MDYLEALNRKKKKALEEHQKIGFPTLPLEAQVRLLMKDDVRILNNLTPEFKLDFIFPAILAKYIKISKAAFRKALLASEYLKQIQKNNGPDGEFIELHPDGKAALKFKDRGVVVYGESYASYDAMIDGLIDKFFNKLDAE